MHPAPGRDTNTAEAMAAGRPLKPLSFLPHLLFPSPPFHFLWNPAHSSDHCVCLCFPKLATPSSLPPLWWTSKIQASPPATGIVSDSSSKMQLVISLGPETSVFNPESKMHTAFLEWISGPLMIWSQHLPFWILAFPVHVEGPSLHSLDAPAAFMVVISAWEERDSGSHDFRSSGGLSWRNSLGTSL